MATIDKSVDADLNDGDCRAGNYHHDSNTLLVGNFVSTNRAWYRWEGIIIPVGATIIVAYIKVTAGGMTGSGITKIYFDDQANPGIPLNVGDYDGRAVTANSVDWDPAVWTSGVEYQSDPIVSIIQELVNSYDYSGGNAMQCLHKDDGSAGGDYLSVRAHNLYPTETAALHIEYTLAAGGPAGDSCGAALLLQGV